MPAERPSWGRGARDLRLEILRREGEEFRLRAGRDSNDQPVKLIDSPQNTIPFYAEAGKSDGLTFTLAVQKGLGTTP